MNLGIEKPLRIVPGQEPLGFLSKIIGFGDKLNLCSSFCFTE